MSDTTWVVVCANRQWCACANDEAHARRIAGLFDSTPPVFPHSCGPHAAELWGTERVRVEIAKARNLQQLRYTDERVTNA